MGRLRRAFDLRGEGRFLLAGAPLFALAMSVSVAVSLRGLGRLSSANDAVLLAIVFAGAALGFLAALPPIRLLALGRGREAALAASLLVLTLATLGFTLVLFALEYRQFYAQWHGPAFSRRWVLEFIGTSAGAVIQFLVLGVRLYLPFGLFFLGAGSFWLARRVR